MLNEIPDRKIFQYRCLTEKTITTRLAIIRITETMSNCPISTPILKARSGVRSCDEAPSNSLRYDENPIPCISPNISAEVYLILFENFDFESLAFNTLKAEVNKIVTGIRNSINPLFITIIFNVARASVAVCPIVNAVISIKIDLNSLSRYTPHKAMRKTI